MTLTARRTTARAATLTYMPEEHEPVLAEELIEILDPQPGELFVDCTFGGGGHARLVAERLGPEGDLIAIDRDPVAEERWREFAETAPCRTRFLRVEYSDGLEMHRRRAAAARRHLPRPRHVLAAARCLASAASPTPTTPRSTCAWTPTSP